MAPGMHTANKSRPTEAVDWLELFPSEQVLKPSEVEQPPVEDPFELFPLERRLLDPPPERRLIDPPTALPVNDPRPALPELPARQLRAVPRRAIRIVVEPVAPVWRLPEIHWRLPEIELSERAWTMILTGVAVMLLIVFVRTRLPLMPEVAHALAPEPARSIAVPSFGLAAPKGVVSAPPAATTGRTLPIAAAQPSLAARVQTSSAKPGSAPPRSADAARSEPAAVSTPPVAGMFGASVNPGSPLTLEPARVQDVALATVVPVAFTPPPAPPARPADPATLRAADTAAIESVLGRYRNAFSALDPRDIQKVWPQVDKRALERTFAEVDQHSLEFDACRIDITGRDARAACSGSASLVPKGSPRPRLESRRWDFTLSKIGSDWLILSAQSRR